MPRNPTMQELKEIAQKLNLSLFPSRDPKLGDALLILDDFLANNRFDPSLSTEDYLYRIREHTLTRDPPVTFLSINALYGCNSNCVMCGMPKDRRDHISLATFYRILDKALGENEQSPTILYLSISGGEPTILIEDMVRWIDCATQKGLWPTLCTNGTLLSRKLNGETYARMLVDGGLYALQISLHSHSPKINQAIFRKPQDIMDRIIDGIKAFYDVADERNEIFINHVLQRINILSLLEFYRFVYETLIYQVGGNRLPFVNVIPVVKYDGRSDIYYPTRDQIKRFHEEVKPSVLDYVKDVFGRVPYTLSYTLESVGREEKIASVCYTSPFTMAVDPEGDVSVCNAIKFDKMHRRDYWGDEHYIELVGRRELTPPNQHICANCPAGLRRINGSIEFYMRSILDHLRGIHS